MTIRPHVITSEVSKAVPGLTKANFRELFGAGYFIATRNGAAFSVLVEHLNVRSEASVVQLIVAELKFATTA